MKTLVNKDNPHIRITAEVEILYDKSRCVKYYYVKDLRLGLLQENWTLVEEEPNKVNCPFDKGDCSYCTVQFCGAREENHIGTRSTAEPLDLEKAAVEYQLKTRGRLNVMGGDAVLSKEEYMKFNSNKDFIAGARWMAEQMKGGSK